MTQRSLLIRSVLAMALTAPFATQTGCAEPQEITRVATFEIDATGQPAPTTDAAPATVLVLNHRLEGIGQARVAAGDQIEVDLYGELTPERYQTLLRYITLIGRLEFRITASPKFNAHKMYIDLAELLPADKTSVQLNGKEVARWVAWDDKEFPTLEVALRRGLVARQAGDVGQALVLVDDGLDVTGADLKSVAADVDQVGHPSVSFEFNAQGSFLFGQLTGHHLPNASGQRYNLGMLLDNRLLSAPTINDKITDRGVISGNMSQDDVNYLVAILKAGALPYRLKLVAERSIAQ